VTLPLRPALMGAAVTSFLAFFFLGVFFFFFFFFCVFVFLCMNLNVFRSHVETLLSRCLSISYFSLFEGPPPDVSAFDCRLERSLSPLCARCVPFCRASL